MTPLIVMAFLAVLVLGMCIGGAVEKGHAHRALMRAQLAEAELRKLRAELDTAENQRSPICAEQVLPAAPVVVNLHLPAGTPTWATAPVVDAHVVPELPRGDA